MRTLATGSPPAASLDKGARPVPRQSSGSRVLAVLQAGFTTSTVQVVRGVEGSAYPAMVTYNLQDGGTLKAVHGPLQVTFVPPSDVTLCG